MNPRSTLHLLKPIRLLILLSLCPLFSQAQLQSITTTASTVQFYSASGGVVIWGLRNMNNVPIMIRELDNHLPAMPTTSATYSLWYHPTAVSGQPTEVSTANGWIQIATSPTITYPATAGIMPILSGINFQMPPNTLYRFALMASAQGPYYGNTGASPDSFDFPAAGARIYLQSSPVSPGYAGPLTGTPASTPRGFLGTIRFSLMPSSPNNASVSEVAAPIGFCPGTHDVKVRVKNTGNNVINFVTVKWTLDGIQQPDFQLNAPLDTMGGTMHPNDTVVTLGTVLFGSAPRSLVAWTESPNLAPDTVNSDDTVSTVLHSALSGTFTIGGSSPDYSTIAAAISDLNNRGVCGPVTFNVAPASGPYTGSINFTNILGASSVNTITFNGNGNTITSASNPVVGFQGASYITIDSFSITNTGTTGFGVHITGNSHHLTLNRNIVTVSTTSTSTASGGIIVSGSATSPTTTGINGSYLTITNNEVIGGYYSMTLCGLSGSVANKGHFIANNTLRDFYAYGAYFTQSDSSQLINNNINRAVRTAVTTFYGIYLNGSSYMKVQRNRLHSAKGTTAYPIYIANCVNARGYETEISNNAIYNLGNSGVMYGIYSLTTAITGFNFYHNTIQHNVASGASAIRGAFFSVAITNVNFKNNIISITGAGTGVKTGIYVTTPSSSFISDHNVLHVNTSASNNIGYWGAAQASIANWRTASNQDHASLTTDPLFTSLPAGDLGTNAPALSNSGAYVGVRDDLNGRPRTMTKPDPGAVETPFIAYNSASASEVVGPVNFCNGNQDIRVRIRNTGKNVLNNVTVSWELNGIPQAPVTVFGPLDTFGSASPSDTVLSLGTVLFGNQTQNIRVWTEYPNSVADTVTFDDTLQMDLTPRMHGTYTIGGTSPNFAHVAEALETMKRVGICGAITFNMAQDSAAYTSTLTFESIEGLSAANPVVFNGNGYKITSSATPILDFNGVSHITFDSLRIEGSGSSYVGVGIHVGGASHHLTFNRNVVSVSTTSTTSTSNAVFISSGSLTTATTSGNNAQYLTITNNVFNGGYYSLTLMGNTGSLDNYGHYVANNVFRDFYIYGAYLANADSTRFINNDINRAGRAGLSTLYGLYLATSRYITVQNNRIHDCGVASYSAYPIYITNCVSTAGYEMELSNNAIYNVGTTSTIYGIYSLTTALTGANIYHNTIQHDAPAASTAVIRGMFFSVATTNVNVRNNIVSITGGGTGIKTGIYVTTASGGFTSNNNLVYVSTANPANDNFGYWGAPNATQTDWYNASGQDLNSKSLDPQFTSVASGNLAPLSVPIDNMGAPVGILTDITGAARSTLTPDVGAYEFTTAFSCTGTPYAGQAASSVSYACVNTPFNLSLTNDSIALGLRYQWLSSGTETGPYTPLANDTLRGITHTQTGTNWYKAVVTCASSGMSDTSATIRVRTTSTALNGLYTIDKNLPPSSTNYTNFVDLVDELNCNGVSGPVIFNVTSTGETYDGNFTFDSIPGASALNTITFNGNGNAIKSVFSPVVGFSRSSYITFDSLHIVGDSGFSGFAIRVSNGSHHLTFNRNYIDAGTYSISTSNAGIALTASSGASTTAGNNGQYITVTNNHIRGGYYSISMAGNASYQDNYGHVISNNRLHDYYIYGVFLTNADTCVISGNDFARPSRTTISTFYGLYTATVRNLKFRDNRIHNSGAGSYTAYPIYMITASVNSPGYETEFVNNAIYDIPTTGTIYAFYLQGTRDRLKFYHNTVALETQAANTVRGLYFTTAPDNHDFRNNIISITGSGTGTKYLIYAGAASSSIISDRNILYIDTTVATNYTGYLTSAQRSLAAWQAASMVDQNSIANNPVFANTAGGDLRPLSINCDNIGTPVGVSTDLTGASRSLSTPDAGAFEFTGVAGDIAITAGRLGRASDCYSSNDSVFITINNIIGTQIDFSINPLSITWAVSGPVNSNGFFFVNSGTLSPGASITISENTVNRSQPGTYTLDAYIMPNAVNNNLTNDTLVPVTSTVHPLLSVATKHIYVNSPSDTAVLHALSPLFPGGQVFISEICYYRGARSGWPAYLITDDYIEITGVPNSDLAGYTLEEYMSSGLVHSVTFPVGTRFSPAGTMIVATGQLGSSVPSPANFYYHSGNTTTKLSSDVHGYIIRNAGGQIIDAVTCGNYTFPSSAGVTAADWTGPGITGSASWAGILLNAPDNNTASVWMLENATTMLTPNALNANLTLPPPVSVSGFSWSLNSVQISTDPFAVAGPYSVPGTYAYVAAYTNACGTYYDTVYVHAGPGVPVKLIRFTAESLNDDVLVSWQTASEKNSSHFEVYRSGDGKTWTLVSSDKAAGNSSTIRNYRIVDRGAMNTGGDVIYYKLKSIDRDGSFEWSREATVLKSRTAGNIAVYPNPFSHDVTLTLPANEQAAVEVITLQGETVLSTTVSADHQQAVVPGLSQLARGIYLIRVTQNGITYTEKLVKQ